MKGRWNYYHNFDYGSDWHRGNRGDHVSGCVDPGSYVSAVDVHNKIIRKVGPMIDRLTDRLAKLPGVESRSNNNRLLKCEQEDGNFKFLQIMGYLQEDFDDYEHAWNLIEGYGAVVGDDHSVFEQGLKDHNKGKGLIPIYVMPSDLYQGSMRAFHRDCKEALTYDSVIKNNPNVREILEKFLNKEAFNKFYHIQQEKPKEEHKEVEVTQRGKALVRDFWKAQKAVKQHEVNPLSYSDWEDLKAFLDTDEGYSAFGKYYNYAKKLVGSWLGESITLADSLKLLRESGIKVIR